MSNAHQEKFSLVRANTLDVDFGFEQSVLDFSSKSPNDFVWAENDRVPSEFADAGVFSNLELAYIGYDPLNRDRFEIRIYAARIFASRVELGVGYSGLLASRWGKLNFGVQAHSPVFGEVLGGDNSSGLMIVNRISTFRRGEDVLIVRTKFHAEHFKYYAEQIATFVGSINFKTPLQNDPVTTALTSQSLLASDGALAFSYRMPGNWARLKPDSEQGQMGQISLWIDEDDPNRNSGAMVTMSLPERPQPAGATPQVDEQAMADLAGTLAGVMIENLLEGQSFKLEPQKKNGFKSLNETTAFNGFYAFNVSIGEQKSPARVSVMMTLGNNGVFVSSTILTVRPVDLYLMGTSNHADFVQSLLLDAQKSYWNKQAAIENAP